MYEQYNRFVTFQTTNPSTSYLLALTCVKIYDEIVGEYTYNENKKLIHELQKITKLIKENALITIKGCDKLILPLKNLPEVKET